MTYDDWATEMRRRYMVLKAVHIIAAPWVDDGTIGRVHTDADERPQRDEELEEVARAWVEVIEWQRAEPRW